MQYVRNGIIIQLTYSLKILLVKTYFTHKVVINNNQKKKSRPRSKLPHWTKNNLFIRHNHVQELEKIFIHDHITHVVKIDIFIGHEDIGNLHFILKIFFHCIFIEKKLMRFLKTSTFNYERTTCCLTKFC